MNTCMMHLIEVCMCVCLSVCLSVCPHINLKVETIADVCFLLGSYVDWRTISDMFARQSHSQGQGNFSESSRDIRLPIRVHG